ncbi:MAG TPA: CPBP family intramembrane glutamic endopeptidase [Polyangiaceae bacterium]|jgi:hypothetical protein|nr:CPBP family intramembrane glutamic endopeptidase [Polyangiaceae bacterium]
MTGIAWQATMPLALGVFFLASRARPALGSLREPVGRVPMWGTVGCPIVTPFALVAWFVLFQPDLSNITQSLPKVELIWRGVIQTRLSALLPTRDAIFLQALSFGAAHAHGFPHGVVGVGLVAVWAIGLGLLRKTAEGLLAPVLAHMVADATIAAIVTGVVLFR